MLSQCELYSSRELKFEITKCSLTTLSRLFVFLPLGVSCQPQPIALSPLWFLQV